MKVVAGSWWCLGRPRAMCICGRSMTIPPGLFCGTKVARRRHVPRYRGCGARARCQLPLFSVGLACLWMSMACVRSLTTLVNCASSRRRRRRLPFAACRLTSLRGGRTPAVSSLAASLLDPSFLERLAGDQGLLLPTAAGNSNFPPHGASGQGQARRDAHAVSCRVPHARLAGRVGRAERRPPDGATPPPPSAVRGAP